MCGIAGLFDPSGRAPQDTIILDGMLERLIHRGPDHRATASTPTATLGYRRLAILDLRHGQQPFCGAGGRVIVFCNGEVFNHRALRRRLEALGHTFRSECDVEVFLHAYLQWGEAALAQIEGQFAVCIYDGRREALLLARDRLGVCPLYTTRVGSTLLFASEIKALLHHPDVHPVPDLAALDSLLCLGALVDPATGFEGIDSVPPGCGLWITAGGQRPFVYWDLDYPTAPEEPAVTDPRPWADALENALLGAIERRLDADVPVGVYLSGGLDSSLLAAMVHRLAPDRPIPSLALYFPEAAHRGIDERRHQQLATSSLGLSTIEVPFETADLARDLAQVVAHAERPLVESYNACSLALARAARGAGVRVVLCGEGADELFAGYAGYLFDELRALGPARPELGPTLDASEAIFGSRAVIYEDVAPRTIGRLRSVFSSAIRQRLPPGDRIAIVPLDREQIAGRSLVHQRSYLDLKIRLAGHLLADHGDRMVQSQSVEARFPYLDETVVEHVRTTPSTLKLSDGQQKHLLRQVAARYLPEALAQRAKQGFAGPSAEALLRSAPGPLPQLLDRDRIAAEGYFDPDVVQRLRAGAQRVTDASYERDVLMFVLTFQLWREAFDVPAHA